MEQWSRARLATHLCQVRTAEGEIRNYENIVTLPVSSSDVPLDPLGGDDEDPSMITRPGPGVSPPAGLPRSRPDCFTEE